MNTAIRKTALIGGIVVCGFLTACAQPRQTATPYYGPQGSYPVSQYPQQQQPPHRDQYGYEYGRVTNLQVLKTHERGRTSGAGAVIGAVVGGLIGNQVGGGSGRSVATAAGVVGGAVAGNAIEGNTQQNGRTTIDGYRVSIQIEGSGATRVFDVPNPGDLRIGDRVRLRDGQISPID
jgi:outer membrane lipoprotein SlyB